LSHGGLGRVLRNRARLAEAEAEFRTALASLQKAVHDKPAFAEIRCELGSSHSRLGDVLQETGRPLEAEAEYRRALAILKKIAGDNPTDAVFRSSLASAQNKLGLQLARSKRFPEAFTALESGLAIRQKQFDADPKNPAYRQDLGWSYADRGKARVLAGQPCVAAADLRRAWELWAKARSLDMETRFEQTRVLAVLAGLGQDPKSGVTAAEAAAFADQAMASLRKAVDAGYRIAGSFRMDSARCGSGRISRN
jgi:tetratricopeptide (TPR) repeat protein